MPTNFRLDTNITVATNRQADIIAGLKEKTAGAGRSAEELEQIAALVDRMRMKA